MLSLVKDGNETTKDEAASKMFDTNTVVKRQSRVPKVMPEPEGEFKFMGMYKLFDHKRKMIKAVALDEIEQIKSTTGVSEGVKRFNEKALEAFQLVAKCKNLDTNKSAKMVAASYYVLLYYVAMYFPDISVELDEEGKVIFNIDNLDPEDFGFNILRFLIQEWESTAKFKKTIPYRVISRIFPDI